MPQQILAKDRGLVSTGMKPEFITEAQILFFTELNLNKISVGVIIDLLDEICFNHVICSKTLFLVFSLWVDLLIPPCKLRNWGFSLPAFNMDEVLCLGLLTQTHCNLP